jgi:hypothetical protein
VRSGSEPADQHQTWQAAAFCGLARLVPAGERTERAHARCWIAQGVTRIEGRWNWRQHALTGHAPPLTAPSSIGVGGAGWTGHVGRGLAARHTTSKARGALELVQALEGAKLCRADTPPGNRQGGLEFERRIRRATAVGCRSCEGVKLVARTWLRRLGERRSKDCMRWSHSKLRQMLQSRDPEEDAEWYRTRDDLWKRVRAAIERDRSEREARRREDIAAGVDIDAE